MDVVNLVEQLPIVHQMEELPTLSEVSKSIEKLNSGKSPGMDGISAEILKAGGKRMLELVHHLIQHCWLTEVISQEWIDATLVSLFKSGQRDDCGNFRGISLLSVVGKVLARVILDRLLKHIAPHAISESQCGFRANDMIFTARQLQEKCTEQGKDLYHCFVDLSKAFDTVNREALWVVLERSGCPSKFVRMIRLLHDGMQARVNFGGELSDPFPVENGVKQGDLDAPTLFAIYFGAMLQVAFRDNSSAGIHVRYRSTGKLFNLRRMKAESKVFYTVVRDILYADDADLVAHTQEDLQSLIDCFDSTADAFGLTINQKKTIVMYQPAPGKTYLPPVINVKGRPLKVVDKFVYLGSTLSESGSLDKEISYRVKSGADSFGKLEYKVWSQHGIKIQAKVMVYCPFVLSCLLFSSETWSTYATHIKSLERFHQNCLRRILNIKWTSFTPDTEVLAKAGIPSIESMILKNRLRWSGHVVRLDDNRIPKQLLYGEIATGTRPNHKPKQRYKDSLKGTPKKVGISADSWEDIAVEDKGKWRQLTHEKVKLFEESRVKHAVLKCSVRKRTENYQELLGSDSSYQPCPQCDRICLSKAGLTSHLRSHELQPSHVYDLRDPTKCHICDKVCKSTETFEIPW